MTKDRVVEIQEKKKSFYEKSVAEAPMETQSMDLPLYQLNKYVVQGLPKLSKEEVVEQRSNMVDWIAKQKNCKYLMLLSHDNKDFTIFTRSGLIDEKPGKVASEVMEIALSRGDFKVGSENENTGGYEMWIGDAFYVLFNYTSGVIEID